MAEKKADTEPKAAVPATEEAPGAEEARKQAQADAEWRTEHPGEVLIRGANKDVGGE